MIVAPKRTDPLTGTGRAPTNRFAEYLERVASDVNTLTAAEDTYTTSNVTESFSYDADTVTLQELADYVGTLTTSLRDAGIIE